MKFKKQELLVRISALANLPPGNNDVGFFSKKQILALYLHLVHVKEEIDKLKARVKNVIA